MAAAVHPILAENSCIRSDAAARISDKNIKRCHVPETEFRKMENGGHAWKKMIGDYLLQRLGVPTEYFEVMADARN